MQDTIIKGTGNSRTLGSVPNFLTLYPTYEAFAQALVNKQVPIDLGPLNSAGVQQTGTGLNKTNLLKDATAAMYGLGKEAVPDDVLAAIKPLIQSAETLAGEKASIATGRYTGTGVNGEETSPIVIRFPFRPKIVIVYKYKLNASNDAARRPTNSAGPANGNYGETYQVWIDNPTHKDQIIVGGNGMPLYITFGYSGTAVSRWNPDPKNYGYRADAMNTANALYGWIILG